MNEGNNIIQVRSTSIILLNFMSDIFLSNILYDLWCNDP